MAFYLLENFLSIEFQTCIVVLTGAYPKSEKYIRHFSIGFKTRNIIIFSFNPPSSYSFCTTGFWTKFYTHFP